MNKLLINRYVLISSAIFSLILSCIIHSQADVLNLDGICYLKSAEAMKISIRAASHLCEQAKWPFYSILIYILSTTIKISYVSAAFLLNSFFTMLSVVSFIFIIQLLTDKIRVSWFAMIVILLAHQFNSVRDYVIRDHGFWAFYLLSIVFILQYTQREHIKYAIAWSACLMVATLFRIEGAIFLLFMPMILLLDYKQPIVTRIKAFAYLNCLSAMVLVCLGMWLWQHHSNDIRRLQEIYFQIVHGWSFIIETLQNKARILGQSILGIEGEHDSTLVFIITLLVYYFINIVANVSLINAILIGYAWIKKAAKLTHPTSYILWSYILLNSIITSSFLAEHMFLSKRYLLALTLVLLLWVPFALESLILQYDRMKLPFILAISLFIISSISPLIHHGTSKLYIKEAGAWLSEHTPASAKLYSNNSLILYYSQHFGLDIFNTIEQYKKIDIFDKRQWEKYDFVAIFIPHEEKNTLKNKLALLHIIPIKLFENNRDDQIIIYKGQRG